ncbi:MAG: serine/threonine-protein phosphatase [Gemmatimonadetes bacterium]|nr:serine/threonine-protein phosphatase [Gemmatimonadota bacterium]
MVLGAVTHVGRVRKENQDFYCALLAPNTAPGIGGVLAVADGMGGHQSGERASQMVIAGVVRSLGKRKAGDPEPAGAPPSASGGGRLDQIRDLVARVNGEVLAAAGTPENRGMGTTLSLAVVEGSTLSVGHVGDSRVYLYRNGSLAQLTTDHSWVAEEVARGALSAEEARQHPRRNLITRAIGIGPAVEPVAFAAELEAGDTILVCSDGLHGMVPDDQIAAVVAGKEPKEAAETLVDMANAAGGSDNVTAVVGRVTSVEPLPAAVWEAPGGRTVAAGRRRESLWELTVLLSPFLLLRWLLRTLLKAFRRR